MRDRSGEREKTELGRRIINNIVFVGGGTLLTYIGLLYSPYGERHQVQPTPINHIEPSRATPEPTRVVVNYELAKRQALMHQSDPLPTSSPTPEATKTPFHWSLY